MSNRIAEILKPKWEREPDPSDKVRLSSFVTNIKSLRDMWGNDVVDKKLANGSITIMKEESMPKEADFDFICLTFNLIPIHGGKAAIAPNAITDIERDGIGRFTVRIHGGNEYVLNDAEMAELEFNIKLRQENAAILKRENYKAELLMQFEVNQELLAEANNRVAPVPGHIVDPRGRRH